MYYVNYNCLCKQLALVCITQVSNRLIVTLMYKIIHPTPSQLLPHSPSLASPIPPPRTRLSHTQNLYLSNLPHTLTHFSSLRALMKMRAGLPGLMILEKNFGPPHKMSVRLLTASREMKEPSLNSNNMGMSLSDSSCCFLS